MYCDLLRLSPCSMDLFRRAKELHCFFCFVAPLPPLLTNKQTTPKQFIHKTPTKCATTRLPEMRLLYTLFSFFFSFRGDESWGLPGCLAAIDRSVGLLRVLCCSVLRLLPAAVASSDCRALDSEAFDLGVCVVLEFSIFNFQVCIL